MRSPIKFFNREKQSYEIEPIYGEGWLRWAYDRPLGKLSVWAIAKRAWFSRWYGWRMAAPGSRIRVLPFVRKYKLDETEFVKRPEDFESFNDFFIRNLHVEVRPVQADPSAVVFPADGRHLGFPDVADAPGIYVKGQKFDVSRLLAGVDGHEALRDGATVVISRLCPTDYHRFHFPLSGHAGRPLPVSGPLYSVSPIALRRRIEFLFENKRVITPMDHPVIGRWWQVEVGATNVGSIVQTFRAESGVEKGSEKGFFQFGGSCVICVFPKGRITLAEDLVHHSQQQIEVYAKMGEGLGHLE